MENDEGKMAKGMKIKELRNWRSRRITEVESKITYRSRKEAVVCMTERAKS